jgi:hypothetical protein
MEEKEKANIWFEWQPYPLQGRLRGIYSLGEKELFETKILRPAGAKLAPPTSVLDWPTHSPAKPGQHWSVRRTAWRHRPCTEQTGRGEGSIGAHTGQAGFYAGLGSEPPPENQIGWGPVPIPDRPEIAPGTPGPMPGWSAFTPNRNQDPQQRRIPVGARWLY